MDTTRAFRLLLHTARQLKKQGLTPAKRRRLLLATHLQLHGFPASWRQ